MWSPDLPAVTARVDFSPPASRGLEGCPDMVRTVPAAARPYVTGDSGPMGRLARQQALYPSGAWYSARSATGPRFGRRDDNSGMGVCWQVSGSTCAPGVVDVAIIPPDKSAGTNTLRHSHARHLLAHGIPIDHLPTWLQLYDTESGS